MLYLCSRLARLGILHARRACGGGDEVDSCSRYQARHRVLPSRLHLPCGYKQIGGRCKEEAKVGNRASGASERGSTVP
eukprot:747802-Hanusia_phi.AAC.2